MQIDTPADTAVGQWMTYGQLAEARSITRKAAVRLTLRHKLRRQPGNDGQTRVWVPPDVAQPPVMTRPPRVVDPDADTPADGPLQ